MEWGHDASHAVDGEDAPQLAWHIWGGFLMCEGDPYRSPVHNGFYGGQYGRPRGIYPRTRQQTTQQSGGEDERGTGQPEESTSAGETRGA